MHLNQETFETDMFLYSELFILQLLGSAGYHYFIFNAALSESAFDL